ncbi:hypothetical protein E2562_001574 [Oryza meyeriana var. granulata]|uniref:J domain-containing protein n=1 Tax=Oryza meyeriana var. granulata TaxID=110450 RepID=A0A6G1CCI4_9ORYZ|nr:hypothetical protein E2562_001574 [Oryza meyeriana var. granulata]
MDPAADPMAATAPFPTIPAAASPRHPRIAKPRRQAAPFRSSDHPVAASSSSSSRRLGVDLPFGHGLRRGAVSGAGAAGSRTSSCFIFGGGDSLDVEGCSPSASSWSSSSESSFVFGASDMMRSFSFGSGKASSSSSFSATVGELTIDDPGSRQGDGDVSGGNDSVPEMNMHSVFRPSSVREEIEHHDEGVAVPSETMGYGDDSKESKFVFVFGENAEGRGFTTNIAETEIKKGDSVEKNNVDQLDASVAEAIRMSLGRMRDALSDCQKATDIDSSFLKAQVRAANCLLALGDVEEAQKGFEICLKSNHAVSLDSKIMEEASDGIKKAQKVSNFMLLSKEYLVKKEFDKIPSALQMISDALSISTCSDNLMMMKAEALLLLQRYEEVIRFCEETLHLAEENSFSLCQLSKIIDLDNCSSSVKLWRYYIIAKSYFFIGKLEEAHQFLKKHEQEALVECRYGKQSQQSVSSFSMAVCELLRLKATGNEAFQAGKYSEAVEYYTAALLSNTESLRFSAICFANRAAAYQAMGQSLDAIADCSLAIALDSNYSKAISRRAGLYELIRDYDQAGNDLRRLISLLERRLQENMSMPSEKSDGIRTSLNQANLRLSALERDAKKGISLNIYLILGIEPSCTFLDIRKAYRKAALRHHPDKAGNFLVRSENIDDAVWREIVNEIRKDADYLFKLIGKAYAILSETTMS